MSIPEAAGVLEGMLRSPSDATRLAALTAIGDGGVTACAPAVPVLLAHGKAEVSDAVRVAAARTLGKLAFPGGARALASAFEDPSEAVRAAALSAAGPVGLALAATQPGDALEFAATLFEHATDERDKAAALRIAGAAPSEVAAAFVKKALPSSTGQATGAACDAAAAIADALAKAGKKDEATALLVAALKGLPVGPRSQALMDKARDLGAVTEVARAQGFLLRWHVIGPFPNAGGSGGFDTVYAPETSVDLGAKVEADGKMLAWQAVDSADIEGKVNLFPLFDPNINVLAYAYTEVEVPSAVNAVLKTGSDDGIAVWVNGEKVLGKNVPRGLRVDEDVVDVKLKAGRNTVLLKVIQGGGDWAYCVRLLGTDNFPVVKP
jgi:hypothetical protein